MVITTWWYFAFAITFVLSENCPGNQTLIADNEGGKWYGYKYSPHSHAHGMCSSYLLNEAGDRKYKFEVKFKKPDGKMEDDWFYIRIEDNMRARWYSLNEKIITTIPPNNLLVSTDGNDFQIIASCINGTIVFLEVGTRARFPVEEENARVEEALDKIANKPPLLRVDQSNC